MSIKLGSLFSGFGGLDLAIHQVFDAETVWVSDIEPGPCKVLAHRFPGVPNLGDITKIDWATVESVDIIAGGSPCQDISSGGRMAGMREGTRSNLWVEMRKAIRRLQPAFVVWENVQAARSTKAASRYWPNHIDNAIAYHLAVSKGINHDRAAIRRHRRAAHRLMELRARCVGVPYPKPALRALGRVLGDLASLGYDTQWHSLRAADIGAPHGRMRYFVLAWRRDVTADTRSEARRERTRLRQSQQGSIGWRRSDHDGSSAGTVAPLLPTPTTQDGANVGGNSQLERNTPPLNAVVTLLPTPAACNPNDGECPETWLERRDLVKAAAKNGNGMGMPLGIAVQLLPTPRATDGTHGGPNQRGSSGDLMLPSAVAMLPTPRATRGGSTTEISYALGGERSDENRTQGHVLLPTPSASDSGKHAGEANGDRWGQYATAIKRWETINGPAPSPTKPGRTGRPKLNPTFAEWMMGARPGWITGVPGVTDNEALRMIGNGVVQRQAETALRIMYSRFAQVLDGAA